MRFFGKQSGNHPQMPRRTAEGASARNRGGNHVTIGKTGSHRAAVDGPQIVDRALAGAGRQDDAGRTAHRGGIAPAHAQGMADHPGHGLADGKINAVGRAGGNLEGNAGRAGIDQAQLAAGHQRGDHQRHKGKQGDQGCKTLRHDPC